MLEKYITKIMSEVESTPRLYKPRFSPSSLPYCPLFGYRDFRLLEKGKLTDEVSFTNDYFFKIGIPTHELLQRWFSKKREGFKAFGCWECERCKAVSGPSFKPKCSCGCSDFKYLELKMRQFGMTAYSDFVAKVKNKWVLFEFKTKGQDYIVNKYKQKYLPDAKHKLQALAYCVMLKKEYDLDIDVACILYIGRDSCWDWKKQKPLFFAHEIEITDSLLNLTEEQLTRALKGFEAAKNKKWSKCWAYRPCLSEPHYQSYMKSAWFGCDCPFKRRCLNGDKIEKKKFFALCKKLDL